MDDRREFEERNKGAVAAMAADSDFGAKTKAWFESSFEHEYSYNFRWLGLPIIQYPQDIVAMQEIMWSVKPELVIETGVARGGSLIFYASLLELLGRGHVLGIDVDIRSHNRQAVEEHPMAKRITMIEGSSTDAKVIEDVKLLARDFDRVLVSLDSNHTHEHVLKELELYAPLVSVGSYCMVFDTCIEDLPKTLAANRPWGKGNNPRTAVQQFLDSHSEFAMDTFIADKLQITVAAHGYLKRLG